MLRGLESQGQSNAQPSVRAKPEIVEEVKEVTNTHLTSNLATKKSLLSYIGTLNHIAGIVEVIRPFMSDLRGYPQHNRKPCTGQPLLDQAVEPRHTGAACFLC